MSSSSSSPFLLHFLFILTFSSVASYSAAFSDKPLDIEGQLGNVGIVYAMSTLGIPPPNKVVPALLAAKIRHVHLINPCPDGVAAFAGTGIDVNLQITNELIPSVAANRSAASEWLQQHVLPFHSRLNISCISVGYHVLSNSSSAGMLLLAIRHFHSAALGFGITVPVSTVLDFASVKRPFPPSASQFNESVAAPTKGVLDFLSSTGGPVLIDLYPYILYSSSAIPDVTTGFATFEARDVNYLTDPGTGQTYENLFDVMVDATISAVADLGYDKLPVVVCGTGWPSDESSDEPATSLLFASEFNSRLVVLNTWRVGTPLRPDSPPKTYIYGLFDEPCSPGSEPEQNWGIWRNDMTPKYGFMFSSRKLNSGKEEEAVPSKSMCVLAACIPLSLWVLS